MNFPLQKFTAGALAIALAFGVSAVPMASFIESTSSSATDDAPQSVQALALQDSQTLVVDSSERAPELHRESYSATSAAEVQAIQQERAAKEKAEAAGIQLAGASAAPKMNGIFSWPVNEYHVGDWQENGFHTSSRPDHNGLDMLAEALTPIYSAHDGTVIRSTDDGGAYGAVVVVQGLVDGKSIITTYPHMSYGTRQVQAGDTIKAGTVLGGVGTTGRSTANHLHFEVKLNGVNIDPRAWLETNLGPVIGPSE